MFVLVIFVFTLAGCGDIISSIEDIISSSNDTTLPTDETPEINKFADEIKNANEFSYRVVYKTTHKADNSIETFIYKFAKSGTTHAFSMGDGVDETIFLVNENYVYMMYISNEGKTATKMVNDGTYQEQDPDFTFLTEFNSSYDFQKKTENVMVGSIRTTCYEYKFLGIVYKYYVNADDYVIKVEYEDSEDHFTMEILDFKTTNIDRTLLTEPTEAAGYEITDLTDLNF